LKEEALGCNLWKTLLGRNYGLVVRQTTWWMNERCGWKCSGKLVSPGKLSSWIPWFWRWSQQAPPKRS
jgi:hypothetical protein